MTIEETGRAFGKAVKDIGNAFCGSIVSIGHDLQTIGKDTIKAAIPEKEVKIGDIVLTTRPKPLGGKKNPKPGLIHARVIEINDDQIHLIRANNHGLPWFTTKNNVRLAQ